MYVDQESIFYYLTVTNEQYAMPAMPDGVRDGILKGLYRFRASTTPASAAARAALRQRRDPARGHQGAGRSWNPTYGVGADVWSVTSYGELYRDGHACERWNMLHPVEAPRVPYVTAVPGGRAGRVRGGVRLRQGAARVDRPLAAASARSRSAPTGSGAARPAPGLRDFFEVDHRYIVLATLSALARDGLLAPVVVQEAIEALAIDSEKVDPAIS